MFRNLLAHLPNRTFFIANVFFWLAIHALFTQIQYRALQAADSEASWFDSWLMFSPWYLNWIWITPVIFAFVRALHQDYKGLPNALCRHLILFVVIMSVYMTNAMFFKTLIVSPDLSYYWTNLKNIAFQLDVLIYLAVVFANMGIFFWRSRLEEQVEVKRLQAALLDEQLKTLHSQLNPHFLFNALNTVASLVRLKREKEAVKALSQLSQMLRKILENKNNTDIKVKDEVAFINSYLAIQKLRFSEKLDTKITVEQDCLDIEIPNMLVHPLVENAVQHGSQLESNKNLLTLDIRREQDELKITLTNKVAQNDRHDGFGIGFSHTQARLSKLYGKFQLELHPVNEDMFETLLAIPIGEQDA